MKTNDQKNVPAYWFSQQVSPCGNLKWTSPVNIPELDPTKSKKS